jgi:hypothetical protein
VALKHFPTYSERLREYSQYLHARELHGLPLDTAIVRAALLDAVEEQDRIGRESQRAGQEARRVTAVAADPDRFRWAPTAEQLAFQAMRRREAPMEEPAAPGLNTAVVIAAAIIRAGQRRRGEIE